MSHTRKKHRPPAEHRAAAPHLFAGGRDHRLREPRAWSWRDEPIEPLAPPLISWGPLGRFLDSLPTAQAADLREALRATRESK